MKITLNVSPSVAGFMSREIANGEKAVTTSLKQAGEKLKTDWRAEIVRAGLGLRLSRSIRNKTFPGSGQSINATALVWSNAPTIISAFNQGSTIRSKSGSWLAIPTEAAGKGARGARITPEQFERKTGLRLRFIFRRRQASLLVAEGRVSKRGNVAASRSKTGRGVQTVPVFILVPQIKLRKRLDLGRSAELVQSGIPSAIVRNWVESSI